MVPGEGSELGLNEGEGLDEREQVSSVGDVQQHRRQTWNPFLEYS